MRRKDRWVEREWNGEKREKRETRPRRLSLETRSTTTRHAARECAKRRASETRRCEKVLGKRTCSGERVQTSWRNDRRTGLLRKSSKPPEGRNGGEGAERRTSQSNQAKQNCMQEAKKQDNYSQWSYSQCLAESLKLRKVSKVKSATLRSESVKVQIPNSELLVQNKKLASQLVCPYVCDSRQMARVSNYPKGNNTHIGIKGCH